MNDMYSTLAIVAENKELEKRMNVIQKELNGVLKSANVIGKALFEIKNQELWKEDYKSFEECAAVFNIKKAQAYNLIKGYEVGEKKLIRKENGNPEKISTLFSNTQCVELAKLKEDVKILEMLDSGKVKPDMTTKEIREVVDIELHPEKHVEEEVVEEVVEEVETTETTETTETSVVLKVEYVAGELKITDNLGMSANDVDKLKALLGKYVK